MRMVRDNVSPEIPSEAGRRDTEILREVLLSEMADESSDSQGEGAQSRGRRKEGKGNSGLVSIRESDGDCKYREDSRLESSQRSRSAREDLPPVARDGARTFRAWGQWSRVDRAAILAAGCTWIALGAGICLVTGSTEARLPDALQDRLGALRAETWDRSGWFLPRCNGQEGSGREKERDAAFTRVDGVEILEPGHHELEQLRAPDGKLYFYDLGGTRHPSFSVGGSLVHNSSCIKSNDSKTLARLMASFAHMRFRLCATATPSPNDYTELGTHAEFLGICTRSEMLSEFFCHDGGETQTWRLKGHARAEFWRWVASWGALVRSPADLGYDSSSYALPPLHVEQHNVPVDHVQVRAAGMLFAEHARTLSERRNVRKASIPARVAKVAELVRSNREQWIIWNELNAEQDAVAKELGDECVSIYGSLDSDEKESRYEQWASGKARILVSKAAIFGYGINMQFCSHMAFVGVTDSWENWHQAIRRCFRFGQTKPVYVHVFASELDSNVVANLERKERDAMAMSEELAREAKAAVMAEVRGEMMPMVVKAASRIEVPAWLRSESAA